MRWIYRRLLTAFFTILSAASLLFFLIRLMPGNPMDAFIAMMVQQYRGEMSYEEIVAQAKALFGVMPTEPLWKQYLDFLRNIFTGNFGESMIDRAPISDYLTKALPWTAFVLSIALLISFVLGVGLGMFLAYKRGRTYEGALTTFLMCWRGVPDYIVALALLWIFSYYLKLFPIGGAYSPEVKPGLNFAFIKDVLWHATLPIMSYVLVHFAFWALMMRGSTISVLGEDYVTVAEARGLPTRRVMVTYVGKNAILPLFTMFMIAIGWIFGGSVFIETIYNYPGIGYYLVQAVSLRDYTLMQGCFMIIIIAVVTGTFLADLLYSKLDPRVRLE
ncbi:MAG: peptide ABC transporter permease [Thermofilum sp. ex4484_15]|nr:MAG: peptide ABC transporter permease [Thermofilum sp. ex4484_15]